jgi:hypothetical protein
MEQWMKKNGVPTSDSRSSFIGLSINPQPGLKKFSPGQFSSHYPFLWKKSITSHGKRVMNQVPTYIVYRIPGILLSQNRIWDAGNVTTVTYTTVPKNMLTFLYYELDTFIRKDFSYICTF